MDAMPIISNRKVILSPSGLILREGKPQATGVRPPATSASSPSRKLQ